MVCHSAPVLWESQDTWPLPLFAPWAIDCWSDAAGGTRQSPWHGVGSVTPFWWADAPSGRKINSGADAGRNRSLDRVMNALELLGPLLTLAAGFEWCRFAAVRIWVDNSAAIHICKKGTALLALSPPPLLKLSTLLLLAFGTMWKWRKAPDALLLAQTWLRLLAKVIFWDSGVFATLQRILTCQFPWLGFQSSYWSGLWILKMMITLMIKLSS